MYSLGFDLGQYNQVVAGIEGLAREMSDLTRLNRDAEAALNMVASSTFATEGPGWAQLSATTVMLRGSAHPILVQSGALRASLTRSGAPGAIRQITPRGFVFGSDLRTANGAYNLAALHQRGTSRMPARPPLDRQRLWTRYKELVRDQLARAMTRR